MPVFVFHRWFDAATLFNFKIFSSRGFNLHVSFGFILFSIHYISLCWNCFFLYFCYIFYTVTCNQTVPWAFKRISLLTYLVAYLFRLDVAAIRCYNYRPPSFRATNMVSVIRLKTTTMMTFTMTDCIMFSDKNRTVLNEPIYSGSTMIYYARWQYKLKIAAEYEQN